MFNTVISSELRIENLDIIYRGEKVATFSPVVDREVLEDFVELLVIASGMTVAVCSCECDFCDCEDD